jgi:hypothetical protein
MSTPSQQTDESSHHDGEERTFTVRVYSRRDKYAMEYFTIWRSNGRWWTSHVHSGGHGGYGGEEEDLDNPPEEVKEDTWIWKFIQADIALEEAEAHGTVPSTCPCNVIKRNRHNYGGTEVSSQIREDCPICKGNYVITWTDAESRLDDQKEERYGDTVDLKFFQVKNRVAELACALKRARQELEELQRKIPQLEEQERQAIKELSEYRSS